MGRQMSLLLTCAWVLWQSMMMGTQIVQTPVLGYDTRAECFESARKSMQPSKTRKQTADGLLRSEDGALWAYTCLPDTVDPRATK